MNQPMSPAAVLDQVCIERQPVINRNGDTIGYELRHHAARPVDGESALVGSAAVLAHLLGNLDGDWLPEGKRVFLQADLALLTDEDFLALLPDGRIVLDLSGPLSGVNEDILLACDALRRRRIALCLDDWGLIDGSPELLVRAEFAKLELNGVDPYVFYERFARLKGLPLKRIARGVGDGPQYRFCRDAGFDLFQGYFFTRPELLAEKTEMGASLAQLVQIFDLVGAQASPREIEDAFKRDPALMLKLLGYINSAGMGMVRKVTSIAHAVQLLGYKQLYRWVALLLYTAGGGESPAALMKTVLTRSRLLELLGRDLVPRHEQDNLFVIGMVSLLDVVFARPLAEALAKLPLPEPVLRAVLDYEGIPGTLLMLVQALEDGEVERVRSIAEALPVDIAAINRAQIEAVGWAESLTSGG